MPHPSGVPGGTGTPAGAPRLFSSFRLPVATPSAVRDPHSLCPPPCLCGCRTLAGFKGAVFAPGRQQAPRTAESTHRAGQTKPNKKGAQRGRLLLFVVIPTERSDEALLSSCTIKRIQTKKSRGGGRGSELQLRHKPHQKRGFSPAACDCKPLGSLCSPGQPKPSSPSTHSKPA